MGSRSALLVLALLVAPAVAVAPTAEACRADAGARLGVPCGRIYPYILMEIPDQESVYPMEAMGARSWEAMLTFKFDVLNEGYTLASPSEPVVITFEFPRKPDWVDLKVEPERIVIDVNNPTYIQADVSDPNQAQAHYVYTTSLRISAAITGQPVLRDGYDYAKLLVFAKSTESGLYQSGYGIKEIRVAPEGALHESDVAGLRDTFTATPVGEFLLAPAAAAFGATTVTLTPPPRASLWTSTPLEVRVDPAPAGRLVASVTDEAGRLVALHGPVSAALGATTFPVTFASPGAHLVAVTLLPGASNAAPAVSFHLPLQVGDVAPEGFAYPKAYLLAESHHVPAPQAHAGDATTQWARDIPFFAFDTAQSTVAGVSLRTPGADAVGRGAANVQFAILDPDGKQLQLASADPVNAPSKSVRIGSLPGDGWYTLRVSGAGLPAGSAYDVRVEVSYAVPPEARNRADGVPDLTGGTLGLGGRNLTLPVDDLEVWKPSLLRPRLDSAGEEAAYVLTIQGPDGRLAYASGQRRHDAGFTPPAPGVHRATAYVEPAPGAAFAPVARTFTFRVGDGEPVVARTFEIADTLAVPTSTAETMLAAYQLPVPGPLASATLRYGTPVTAGLRLVVLDKDGSEVASSTREPAGGPSPDVPLDLPPDGAPYALVAYGRNAFADQAFTLAVVEQFEQPVTLEEADEPPALPETRIPGFAMALAVATLGAVAVAAALARRS